MGTEYKSWSWSMICMNALEAFQASYFFWSLGFVEIKEILWLSKDNVCDILLDVSVVIVQKSYAHIYK